MYITRGSKIFLTILCKYIKRKNKYNKGITQTDDYLVICQSTMLTVARFLQLSFCIGDTILFVLRNKKLDMLVVETLPELFTWAKFHCPTDFQRVTMNKKLSKSLHTWNSPTLPYLHPSCI